MKDWTMGNIRVLAVLLVLNGGGLRASDDKQAICEAAMTAYAANLHSFTRYQCRYSYAQGYAKSIDDAVQGRFINLRSYDNRLLVDGEKDFYEALGPVEKLDPKKSTPVPGHEGLSMIDVFYRSERYLSDGEREVYIIPQFNVISFHDGEGPRRGITDTPLGMHMLRHRGIHGPDFLKSRRDTFDMICDGLEEVDGLPMVTVRFKRKQYNSEMKFCFDASRGYLPARMETIRDGKVRTRVLLTHAIEVNGQRWFPERSVAIDMMPGDNNLYRVTEIKVLELEVDRRPPADEFAIKVAGGTPVEYVDHPGKRFVLRQPEVIGVDDLVKLESMLNQVGTTPLMDTAIPRGDRRWYWLGAVAGVAIALGSLIVWRWRRFHSH
jgi:hypothetical protein